MLNSCTYIAYFTIRLQTLLTNRYPLGLSLCGVYRVAALRSASGVRRGVRLRAPAPENCIALSRHRDQLFKVSTFYHLKGEAFPATRAPYLWRLRAYGSFDLRERASSSCKRRAIAASAAALRATACLYVWDGPGCG